MSSASISRRGFIAAGAALVGRLAFPGGPIALLAPSRSWALPLRALDAHSGATLLSFTRHLYPHDTLEDAVYALVVKALDDAANDNADTATLLAAGVAELDAAANGDWLTQTAATRLAVISARENTPFFQQVRATAVVALYDNALAFAHFGYEGPAFDKGGYLGRGFNDLNWLPEPPAAASPRI